MQAPKMHENLGYDDFGVLTRLSEGIIRSFDLLKGFMRNVKP